MLKALEAEKYINKGVRLGNQGKYAQAIIQYKKAISLEPDLIKDAYIYWGFSLSYQNDYHGAIATHKKVICMNPSDGRAHHNIGVFLSCLSHYEEALMYYEKAIAFNYDLSRSYNSWGYCLGYLERYDEAIEKLRKAIARSHDYDIAYINCGIVFYHQGAILKAKQAYKLGIMKTISNNARIKGLMGIYEKQIDIVKKQLIASNTDETIRSRLTTRLEALEQVLNLLQLPSEELSKMLTPSSCTRRNKPLQSTSDIIIETNSDLKLSKYYESLYNEFVTTTTKSWFRNEILQVVEREENRYNSVSQAFHWLQSHFSSFCGFNKEISSAQYIQKEQTMIYRNFIDHFISCDEVKYVLEKLGIKLSAFRVKRILFETVMQENFNNARLSADEEETYKEKLREYVEIDKRIVTVVFLLEGVEVLGYKSVDEKIENIADGIFKKAKEYIERLESN